MNNNPKTLARNGVKQVGIELLVLFVLTTVGTSVLLDTHWFWAMLLAPVMMLLMLAAIALFVQVLWMAVLGLERVGQACGLRKSPLA